MGGPPLLRVRDPLHRVGNERCAVKHVLPSNRVLAPAVVGRGEVHHRAGREVCLSEDLERERARKREAAEATSLLPHHGHHTNLVAEPVPLGAGGLALQVGFWEKPPEPRPGLHRVDPRRERVVVVVHLHRAILEDMVHVRERTLLGPAEVDDVDTEDFGIGGEGASDRAQRLGPHVDCCPDLVRPRQEGLDPGVKLDVFAPLQESARLFRGDSPVASNIQLRVVHRAVGEERKNTILVEDNVQRLLPIAGHSREPTLVGRVGDHLVGAHQGLLGRSPRGVRSPLGLVVLVGVDVPPRETTLDLGPQHDWYLAVARGGHG